LKESTDGTCSLAVPDVCPEGQYCKLLPDTIAGGTCTVLPADGQPCAEAIAGPECAPITRCENGTCRSLKASGASCQSDDSCYSDECVAGSCVIETPCN
jgi:hypothetical protein